MSETITENKNDTIRATNIIKKLFKHFNMCLNGNRSKHKIGNVEKALIKSLIGQPTADGLCDYVEDMYANDLKALLDDLQVEFSGR